MLNGDKCHRKNSTEEGRRSSEMLGMVEAFIVNREVKIELTAKVKKTNLSKDARA